MAQTVMFKLNIVREAFSLLYIENNEEPLEELQKQLNKKYHINLLPAGKRLDCIIQIYDYVEKRISCTNDRLKFFFGKFEKIDDCLASFVLLPDDFHNTKTLEEDVNRVQKISDSRKIYEYIARLESSLGCEGLNEQILTFVDLVNSLQQSELSTEEKWLVQQAFIDKGNYLSELADILKEVIVLILECNDKIDWLLIEFSSFWNKKLKDNNIYNYMMQESSVTLDRSKSGYVIIPSIMNCNSIRFVADGEKTDTPQKDIFYIGCLLDDDFNINTQLDDNSYIHQCLKLLSDKSKFEILMSIKDKKAYGAEIAKQMNLTTPTISHHMTALLDAGLVTIEKENTKLYYMANKDKITELLDNVKILLE